MKQVAIIVAVAVVISGGITETFRFIPGTAPLPRSSQIKPNQEAESLSFAGGPVCIPHEPCGNGVV
jgi:hypothetical protein